MQGIKKERRKEVKMKDDPLHLRGRQVCGEAEVTVQRGTFSFWRTLTQLLLWDGSFVAVVTTGHMRSHDYPRVTECRK